APCVLGVWRCAQNSRPGGRRLHYSHFVTGIAIWSERSSPQPSFARPRSLLRDRDRIAIWRSLLHREGGLRMQGVFDLLGVLLAIYTAYAAVSGQVYARHRAWGRTVVQSEEPGYFWSIIVIYGLLSVALIVYF